MLAKLGKDPISFLIEDFREGQGETSKDHPDKVTIFLATMAKNRLQY